MLYSPPGNKHEWPTFVEFLLRQSFEGTQEEGRDGEGAAIFLLAKSSLGRSTVHTAVKALSQCKSLPRCSACEHREGLYGESVDGHERERRAEEAQSWL